VHRPTGGLPRIVRGAGAEARLVRDDAWVAADLLRTLCVTKEIRVVALLPHEHEMRSRHELGDEAAPGSGARKRIRAYAVPPFVRRIVVTRPQLFVDVRRDLFDDAGATEAELLPFHARNGSG
jgi:hypothetical protein